MKDNTKQHIFFVDDEPKIRQVVGETLEESGFKVSCFSSAADCLEKLRSQVCDLLITDVKMPDSDGIELLTEIQHIVPWLPVLLVTGYGDVPMATAAFKAGAVDKQVLLSAVESALKRINPPDPILGKVLTRTEKKVLRLILDGKSNKEIALLLGRAMRTIEVHRSRIMRKLGVNNAVDLVKRAGALGLLELTANKS
jgi:two-component system response regulator FixJ